jgi:hypothetical protein
MGFHYHAFYGDKSDQFGMCWGYELDMILAMYTYT